MCTLIIINRATTRYPVVIAANRDELYARDSGPAQILRAAPRIVGGLDRHKGGTWLGATASGTFVGITNQRTYFPADRSKRSRGDVVMRSLELGERRAIRDYLRQLPADEFNPFNLLFGDAGGLDLAYVRPGSAKLEITAVPAGVSVLPNDVLDSEHFPKVARAKALLAHVDLDSPTLLDELAGVLADRQRPPLDRVEEPPPGSPLSRDFLRELHALCIHTEVYGTRSASIVALGPNRVEHFGFASGPPTTTDFSDITHLLTQPVTN